MKLSKIISGGQTGVDRAALDAAMILNIPNGGFCPKGRRAEDGIIPDIYNLDETLSFEYAERTKKNVQHSQGTLILFWDTIKNGSLTTLEYCRVLDKPHFILDMNKTPKYQIKKIDHWIKNNQIKILNIAGPREDGANVYKKTNDFLINLLSIIFKGKIPV